MAKQAGLKLGVDYEAGDAFRSGAATLYTAKLLGPPVGLTVRLIDKLGFYGAAGNQRWSYVAMPAFVWNSLTLGAKAKVIGWMYAREGGAEMKGLFA